MKTVLVTGSSGLIGSAVAEFLHRKSWAIHGLDNNMRADFFGPEGDTNWNLDRLRRELSRFTHHPLDIRSRDSVRKLIAEIRPDAIVHCAAQPAHDRAAKRPFDDFGVTAVGPLNFPQGPRQASTTPIFDHLPPT